MIKKTAIESNFFYSNNINAINKKYPQTKNQTILYVQNKNQILRKVKTTDVIKYVLPNASKIEITQIMVKLGFKNIKSTKRSNLDSIKLLILNSLSANEDAVVITDAYRYITPNEAKELDEFINIINDNYQINKDIYIFNEKTKKQVSILNLSKKEIVKAAEEKTQTLIEYEQSEKIKQILIISKVILKRNIFKYLVILFFGTLAFSQLVSSNMVQNHPKPPPLKTEVMNSLKETLDITKILNVYETQVVEDISNTSFKPTLKEGKFDLSIEPNENNVLITKEVIQNPNTVTNNLLKVFEKYLKTTLEMDIRQTLEENVVYYGGLIIGQSLYATSITTLIILYLIMLISQIKIFNQYKKHWAISLGSKVNNTVYASVTIFSITAYCISLAIGIFIANNSIMPNMGIFKGEFVLKTILQAPEFIVMIILQIVIYLIYRFDIIKFKNNGRYVG